MKLTVAEWNAAMSELAPSFLSDATINQSSAQIGKTSTTILAKELYDDIYSKLVGVQRSKEYTKIVAKQFDVKHSMVEKIAYGNHKYTNKDQYAKDLLVWNELRASAQPKSSSLTLPKDTYDKIYTKLMQAVRSKQYFKELAIEFGVTLGMIEKIAYGSHSHTDIEQYAKDRIAWDQLKLNADKKINAATLPKETYEKIYSKLSGMALSKKYFKQLANEFSVAQSMVEKIAYGNHSHTDKEQYAKDVVLWEQLKAQAKRSAGKSIITKDTYDEIYRRLKGVLRTTKYFKELAKDFSVAEGAVQRIAYGTHRFTDQEQFAKDLLVWEELSKNAPRKLPNNVLPLQTYELIYERVFGSDHSKKFYRALADEFSVSTTTIEHITYGTHRHTDKEQFAKDLAAWKSKYEGK